MRGAWARPASGACAKTGTPTRVDSAAAIATNTARTMGAERSRSADRWEATEVLIPMELEDNKRRRRISGGEKAALLAVVERLDGGKTFDTKTEGQDELSR